MNNAQREFWMAQLASIVAARYADADMLSRLGGTDARLPVLVEALVTDAAQLQALRRLLAHDLRVAKDAGRKAGRPRGK